MGGVKNKSGKYLNISQKSKVFLLRIFSGNVNASVVTWPIS